MGPKPKIGKNVALTNAKLGKYVSINDECVILESTIGDYSYCNGYNQIMYSKIGKFASIAWGARINPVNHPIYMRVAQHHFTYRSKEFDLADEDDETVFNWRRKDKVIIGNDVWIGHNAIIMPGVKIGNGAVIGAGAIVTKDVEPYSVVVGNPAHKIKQRFSNEIIEKLEKSKWWEWSHDMLKERLQDFKDVNKFIEKWCGGKND